MQCIIKNNISYANAKANGVVEELYGYKGYGYIFVQGKYL